MLQYTTTRTHTPLCRMRLLLIAFTAALTRPTAALSNDDIVSFLDGMWTSADVDGSGGLSSTEFMGVAMAMGLDQKASSILTKPVHAPNGNEDATTRLMLLFNDCITNYADSTDANAAEMSTTEIVTCAAAHQEYFDALVNLFTNGAGSIPEGLTEAPAEEITSAKANIAQTFGVSQPPSLILAGTRKMIRDKWCTLASVSGDSCTIEVVAKGGVHIDDGHGNVISFRRKLQSLPVDSSSGSDITVTMYFADASAAEDALDALPSDAAAVESALLTLPVPFQTTVSDVETSDVESDWELPFFLIGVIGGALAGAGLIICLLASLVSNSVRQSKNQENAGCCGTGCCSFNAVKAWAFGEFASCLLIAVGVFLLYSNMQGLTDIFVYLVGTVLPGLVDPTLLGISDTSQIQQVQSMANMIPAGVVNSISQYEEQVKLLPFAVMGPGALCIVFLLLGALCPCHPRQGTYICTKLMNFFATVFLLLSFIFYLIFVGVSVTLKYAPPAVQVQIDQIMGMCTSIPMNMRQLVADNAVAIEKVYAIALTNAGGDAVAASQDASVVSAQAMLASAGTLYQTVDGGCNALKGIFTEFENLFVPGLTCVVSIVFALFVNNTLCCAAGCCCKAPPVGGVGKGVDHVTV